MNHFFQKFIASLLVIGLILSLGFNVFLFKPKEVKAGVPTVDTVNAKLNLLGVLKEYVFDAIPRVVVGLVKGYIYKQMIRWAQGGYTDANESFAITNWGDFLLGAAVRGSAKYIAEFRKVFDVTDSFESGLESSLEFLGFGTPINLLPTYAQYAKPTLRTILELSGVDYQKFVNSGHSLRVGGWNSWFALMQPQNNIFGQVLMAERARGTGETSYIDQEKEAARLEGLAGSGYRDETECVRDAGVAACEQECAQDGPPTQQCLASCANQSNGICLQYRTKNLGSLIHSSMEQVIGADLDWIVNAEEITELVGLFFMGLYNRIRGQGIAQSPGQISKSQLQSYQYSYYPNFKKAQTPEEKQKVRISVLNSILKSIKQLGMAKTCDKDEQIRGKEASQAVVEILEGAVQHLYVGMEGVNLQPDFEILDPLRGPYKYYGYAWSDIPYNKYSPKCQAITEEFGSRATCGAISSGLAPTNPACECIFDDPHALMCPPAPYPPASDPSSIMSVITQKQNFYNSCKGQYDQVQKQCQNCLDNAKQCENKTGREKTDCLTIACSNWQKVSGATNGEDFYNKCLIEQQKQNCFTCLKEYFIPADYCEQTSDYINRSFVKYPLVVYDQLWWGWHDTATCSDNRSSGQIPVGLICKILPDFKYNGVKVCEQYCLNNLSAEEKEKRLEDVYDFSPSDADCQNIKIGKAFHPGGQYNDYLVQRRATCCAALNANSLTKYAACIGEGPPEVEEEPEEEQVCHNGAGINPHTGEMSPDGGETLYGFASTNLNIERSNTPFIYPILENGAYDWNCTILRSQSPQVDDVTIYITEPYCDAYRGSGNKVYWSDINGDGSFSDSFVRTHPTHSEPFSYCCNTPQANLDQNECLAACPAGKSCEYPEDCAPAACTGGFKSPPPDKILCTFDIDAPIGSPNGPTGLDPATGEPYKICCGLSQGHDIQYSDRNACISAGVPAEVCNDYPRYMTGGLYMIAVPDTPDSLGGAEWCACSQGSWCGERCASAMCPVNTTPQ